MFALYDVGVFGLPPRVRRTIDGVENIDRRKSYVIVLNHTSGVDIIAAYKIPLNFRWVSKREVFRIPFFGPMLLVHGDIPIERGNAAAAMAKVVHQGKIWLGRGASVAIFPRVRARRMARSTVSSPERSLWPRRRVSRSCPW